MNLSGLPGRIAYAVLAGLITFIVVLVLGVLLNSFSPEIGSILTRFAAPLGVLVGLVTFFLSPGRPVV